MVKWTAHAKAQLRHIHDYIAEDSPLYARRVSEELVQKTIGLDELPRKGHKVPELNEDVVRELGLYSYRIIYEIKSEHLIEVLAVIHKRQHVESDDIPKGQ
ncbi:type II toxin-antitoxin system RelE/ParE family toxin [uncultured Marinobacter sp.]|uniref:type II toxin-antitoxin system RelE/ParE family toxin n=1 Tax=uncultured Marinobacter sp. TaxID=187379 RepID=UPI0030D91A52|tara:strand:- start:4307 stop:4609 length:303 start_codon:yes stop_codon:yes gene_type:complete